MLKKIIKKPKASTLKAKADSLWSLKIRSGGVCHMAGFGVDTKGKGVECTGNLEAAHIKSRRYLCLRYDMQNGVCLCSAHHRLAHNHPDLFIRWIEASFPGRIDYLNKVMQSSAQKVDYKQVILKLQGVNIPKPTFDLVLPEINFD